MTLYPHQIAILDALEFAPKKTFVIRQSRQTGITTLLFEYVKKQLLQPNNRISILFVAKKYDTLYSYLRKIKDDVNIQSMMLTDNKSELILYNGSSINICSSSSTHIGCSRTFDLVIMENVDSFCSTSNFNRLYNSLIPTLSKGSKVIYTCQSIPEFLIDCNYILYCNVPWYVVHSFEKMQEMKELLGERFYLEYFY